jgi:putative tricarboxylic transport membrane protein
LFVQRRKLVPTLITTAVTLAMIETIFVLWLRIRLPRGFLGF